MASTAGRSVLHSPSAVQKHRTASAHERSDAQTARCGSVYSQELKVTSAILSSSEAVRIKTQSPSVYFSDCKQAPVFKTSYTFLFINFPRLLSRPYLTSYMCPWSTNTVISSSYRQQYIVWVKIIHFSFMTKIIRILSYQNKPYNQPYMEILFIQLSDDA